MAAPPRHPLHLQRLPPARGSNPRCRSYPSLLLSCVLTFGVLCCFFVGVRSKENGSSSSSSSKKDKKDDGGGEKEKKEKKSKKKD